MSKVDEALRRAALEGPALLTPTAVEPAAVAVDATALNGFVREREAAVERPNVTNRPAPARTPSSAASGLPPRAASVGQRINYHASLEGKIVCSRETSALSVEQYRRLAAGLVTVQAERGIKTLMVSSSMPNEGKTLTVTNLALTLSEAYGRRVLLVDADFRRPCVHEMFGMMNTAGLAEALQADRRSPSAVSVSPNLSVVPTGQLGETAIGALSSERMRTFVANAAERFEWVLIDTPPIGLLSDANLVARLTDAVVFVVAAGVTPCEIVQRSLAEVGPERVIGIVLNRAPNETVSGHEYYGEYYGARR